MSQFPGQQPTFSTPTKQPGDGLATASLILGIIGFVTFLVWGGIPFGITGIILALVARGKGFKGGKLTAGLIFSIVGLVFSLGWLVACIACFAIIMEEINFNDPLWFDRMIDEILFEMGL
ncbi:MAG: hypothetical protein FWB98_07015 [Defluviitaleaceae bacterium]|nr:hypothetical protein [Defluviitaleaceae bacterium]